MNHNCLFICSPGLGLLDNWIPVLDKLKKKKINVDIFFPKIKTIEQFRTSNFLSDQAVKIFNNVIYQDLNGELFISKFNKSFIKNTSLNKYLKITRSYLMKFLNQEAFLGDNIFYKLNNILIKFKQKHVEIDMSYLNNYSFICYDMYEESKSYIKKYKIILKKIKKFSLHHGSDFPAANKKKYNKIKVENIYPILFTTSNLEKEYYKNNYNFKNNPKLLGCPKHDEKWRKLLQKQKINYPFKEKYILLISRNVDNNYLPSERKKKYLQIIKKNLIDKNYKIAVKLHPKEDSESGKNFYFKIFKKKDFKKKWTFSTELPLQLSKKAIFVITFFSGVAVDMSALRKTTIELLDLKGLEHKAAKSDIFYEKFSNEPVFRVRYSGFVLGASNENEFINKVKWFLNNQKKSNNKFYLQFTKIYKHHRKAAQNVYNYILNNI